MGRGKGAEPPASNPLEAKKHRDEASGHFKSGNYTRSLASLAKAIELSPEDRAAHVARSRCHLLLGEPRAALQDAEAALALDPKHVQALLYKAEALYYCGEFELSLVHYHRGRRARPDLHAFRLGVQKAQEAIENTIGAAKPRAPHRAPRPAARPAPRPAPRPVLGQLMADKIYLQGLLQRPGLELGARGAVARQAEEALKFLENREEFWRQQQTAQR